ncbi:MAG: hypothetical protein QXN76_01955, partial [Nanopusillaceae archaeon]
MRDTRHSMLRHPMDISENGIYIHWDKYLRIYGNYVKIENIQQEEIIKMKKAIEDQTTATKSDSYEQ